MDFPEKAGSQMILYFGAVPEEETVTVPDLMGMTRQQASDTAGKLGLYIRSTGNTGIDTAVVVTAQSIPKDTQVPPGTTIQLEFTDTKIYD